MPLDRQSNFLSFDPILVFEMNWRKMTAHPLRKWILMAALLTLLVSSNAPVTAASSIVNPSSAPAAPAGWLLFQNNTWQYSIHYPPNWTAAAVLTNSSASAMNVIRQRDELTGLAGAFVSIDVWQKSPATNLISWVNNNQGQMLAFAEVTIPAATNAVISGQPALIIAQPESGMSPGLMMAYIDAADRVLLVQYIAGDRGSALNVFETMLDSVTITPLSAALQNLPKSIPPLTMPPTDAGHKGGSCVLAPNGDGCCGHPQITHWRCAADSITGEHKGNCVYWAALMRPDVGRAVGSGNANQWAKKAVTAGLDVDTTPRLGDIMVDEGLSVYGHVAYVISVSSTTVTVTEMNWCSTCPERSKVYSISGKKFIHGDYIGGPNLIAPTGQTTITQPIYSWNDVEDTEDYLLNIFSSSGDLIYEKLYDEQNICNQGLCSVTPPMLLVNDTYVWKVQAHRTDSTRPWSQPMAFSVGRAANLTAPSGTVYTAQPAFTWENVPGAASYNLQINLPDEILFEKEYPAADICSGSACSVIPESLQLAAGVYTWRVETLDSNGIGPWSEDMAFQVLVTTGETAILTGSLTLPGRPQPPDPSWSTALTLKLTPAGDSNPMKTEIFERTTDANGQIVIPNLTPGAYTLLIKPAGALQKSFRAVELIAGNNQIDFGKFALGDANNDNYVNATDFSLLSAAYSACKNKPLFNPTVDFNNDGCVTATDFSLLAGNYGLGGEE
jgi:surface antigen